MAPAAVITPAPSTPVSAIKANGAANGIKVDTSQIETAGGIASAASSILSKSSASTSSSLSLASSATSVSSASSSFKFEDTHIETSIHKVATQITVDNHTGALIAEGVLVHGVATTLNFDLPKYLGVRDGKFVWNDKNYRNYHRSCKDIKIVIEQGSCLIVASCHHKDNQTFVAASFNLSEVLYILHGKFEVRETSFSRILSEVPWMKFKVIAEPDYGVFVRDQVIQKMMMRIAESTVQHVTAEMNQHIQVAMAAATEVVMASAMQHVAEQMQVIVQGATAFGKPQRSMTTLSNLHII